MTTIASNPHEAAAPARFANGAEWLHALGDVPLERVVMNPPPGMATEQDLLTFVDRDKRLVELIDGTLVEKPVGWLESQIALRLAMALGNFVYPRRLGAIAGEAGPLRMRRGQVRLPDISFTSAADLPGGKFPHEPIPALPPTLAVEVLSESNTPKEMRRKIGEYFESGAKLVWIIDPPPRTIAISDAPTVKSKGVLFVYEHLDTLMGGAVKQFVKEVAA